MIFIANLSTFRGFRSSLRGKKIPDTSHLLISWFTTSQCDLVNFTWKTVVLYCIVFSIYPPDSQESDRGAIHRAAITPTCFRRYRDIAVRLIFFLFVIEIRMTVIWYCLLNRQAGESIAKCLSQGHNNMTTPGFEPRPYRSKIARVTFSSNDNS